MPRDDVADITVVCPIIDPRGHFVESVRSWTQEQTLARTRYRVIVPSHGATPELDAAVAPLLGPEDRLLRVSAAASQQAAAMALWNAGAAAAGTRWLVLSEGHCEADPGCLAALAQWVDAGPDAEIGNLTMRHISRNALARISGEWTDSMVARWQAPGEWPRLHDSAFAIRADVFEAARRFEHEFGLFAIPLLGARLHARGSRVGYVSAATVRHVDEGGMAAHHADVATYARDEMKARACNEPVFFERYFGHSPLWTNQLRDRPRTAWRLAWAVLAAARAEPGRIREIVAGLRPLAAALVTGVRLRAALHRWAVQLDEFAIERLPLPARWLRTCFLRVHRRTARLAQLQWMTEHTPPAAVARQFDRWPVEHLGPDAISGVHGLEQHGGLRFRWTEPVVLLRLAPAAGEYEIRIDTALIRGRPLHAVVAAVIAGRTLPRELLSETDDGTLVVRLPGPWSAAARNGLILVCSALSPARHGRPDARLLGLPIVSIASVPLHAAQHRMAAA